MHALYLGQSWAGSLYIKNKKPLRSPKNNTWLSGRYWWRVILGLSLRRMGTLWKLSNSELLGATPSVEWFYYDWYPTPHPLHFNQSYKKFEILTILKLTNQFWNRLMKWHKVQARKYSGLSKLENLVGLINFYKEENISSVLAYMKHYYPFAGRIVPHFNTMHWYQFQIQMGIWLTEWKLIHFDMTPIFLTWHKIRLKGVSYEKISGPRVT